MEGSASAPGGFVIKNSRVWRQSFNDVNQGARVSKSLLCYAFLMVADAGDFGVKRANAYVNLIIISLARARKNARRVSAWPQRFQ
ncbi:hypothetical protein [Erwinia sp. HR93]|uniref:hypothetical protein n=1 Tax=Erwinia sp. HR93 TaxID=3094840 RepID=UPI002ADEE362|nr:hypothetical protein [Erwinia sp. HR93]MEA1065761.1 hypothetical protein [Erwinia sp. HR93]